MSRFRQTFVRVAVVMALGAAVILACGPFFGIEVLGSRKQVLLAPPTISFENELKTLVPPPKDKLPMVESDNPDQDVNFREKIDAQSLDSAVSVRVAAMRQQKSGEAAYAAGEVLPQATRLYAAGAVSFLHGQIEAARTYFQNILALPADQRKSREVWAHFMLGRIAVKEGNQAEATAQFEATRALVRQGASDPLGLAVSSFGEQARVAWKEGAIANAVSLYAQQASYGSQSGVNSLVTVASLILKDPNLLDRGIQDPVTRRLLFICVNGNNGRPFFIELGQNGHTNSTVDRIAAALERHQLTEITGAGLLASAAYDQGRFDLAQRLSALEDVPISAWVMAKLALRRGDREAALKAYEKALKGFPAADSTVLRAEIGVLRVSRGDYIQALSLFYRAATNGYNTELHDHVDSNQIGFADYWGDAAYLAERVLTIGELQSYVDRNSLTAGSRISSILARRLMRAGQYREAIPYFDDDKTREAAQQYASALDRATSWWRLKRTKAEAWFAAAKLAHNSGMELLGFEREPDYAMWDGSYDGPVYFDDLHANTITQGVPTGSYQTEDERKRVAASKPERDVRFQYRLTAVDHATKAADLLPTSSQAYAAVLCEATAWVIDRQPEQAAQIYQRYLHHGAYVPWGNRFGRQCPSPDFAAASSWRGLSHQEKHLARHARAHPFYASTLAIVAVGILTTSLYYGRAQFSRKNLNND